MHNFFGNNPNSALAPQITTFFSQNGSLLSITKTQENLTNDLQLKLAILSWIFFFKGYIFFLENSSIGVCI
jgi:hypothetical protein